MSTRAKRSREPSVKAVNNVATTSAGPAQKTKKTKKGKKTTSRASVVNEHAEESLAVTHEDTSSSTDAMESRIIKKITDNLAGIIATQIKKARTADDSSS